MKKPDNSHDEDVTLNEVMRHNDVTHEADDNAKAAHENASDILNKPESSLEPAENTGENSHDKKLTIPRSKGPFLTKTPYDDTPTILEEPSTESKYIYACFVNLKIQ